VFFEEVHATSTNSTTILADKMFGKRAYCINQPDDLDGGESRHDRLELSEDLSGDETIEAAPDFPRRVAFGRAALDEGAGSEVGRASRPGG
jgi:hypothetical protein